MVTSPRVCKLIQSSTPTPVKALPLNLTRQEIFTVYSLVALKTFLYQALTTAAKAKLSLSKMKKNV